MNHDDKSLLVGFLSGVPLNACINELTNLHGFIRVLHTFHLTNAVLIQIDPIYLEDVIRAIVKLESTEFVDRNFIISPASFNKITNFDFITSHCHSEKIFQLHKLKNDPDAGRCVRIAVIDTGMSPHPYLPAMSFNEMIEREEYYCYEYLHKNISNYFDNSRLIEKNQNKNPFNSGASISDINAYLGKTKAVLKNFYLNVFSDWSVEADNWYQKYKQTGPTYKKPKIPELPIFPREFGYCRKISHLSHNFIDDNLDLSDTSGHGTNIIGIIAGRPWASNIIPKSSIQKNIMNFEFDVNGIVPCAEILVLKVYDENKKNVNYISNVMKALEYAYDNEADLIYVGFEAPQTDSNIKASSYINLDKIIERCNKSEIPVICPAGNSGIKGLSFPASCGYAWAISSVFLSGQHINCQFSPNSNYADRNEQEAISFAAFGGDEDCEMLTTSSGFGFDLVKGTSVAAAIATGIFADYYSKCYLEHLIAEHNNFMLKTVSKYHRPPSQLPRNKIRMKKPKITEVHSKAERYSDKLLKQSPAGLPDERVGYGMLRRMHINP